MDWSRLSVSAEPVMWVVGVGTGIVQAGLQVLIAFGVPITSIQQAALTALAVAILAAWARAHVAPMASLPPGVAGQIADAKAANPPR